MAHDKSQPGTASRIKARGKVQDGEGEEAIMTVEEAMTIRLHDVAMRLFIRKLNSHEAFEEIERIVAEEMATVRADARVKAWNGALEKLQNKLLVTIHKTHKWNWCYDLARDLRLPEAQPVERISEADHQTLDTLHREGSY